tara:strand:- start:23321 stop:25237 length:1917 start_codon:yes stop_codon:yes gene_type:complete
MMDLSGARQGLLSGIRSVIAAAMARDLRGFVIPGEDVANALGLDLDAAGLIRVATPRHASVLLIAGPLPPALVDAASVVWAQMPRPRCILALGSGGLGALPTPDVTVDLSQEGLLSGLEDLRRLVRKGAFARDVTDFDAPALSERIEFTCPMHPEVVSDAPGKCPKCGMFLVERRVSGAAPNTHEGHEGHSNSHTSSAQAEKAHHHADAVTSAEAPASYTCPMHPEVSSETPGSCPKCGMDLVPQTEAGKHGHGAHGGHKHHKDKPTQEDQGGYTAHTAYGQQDAHSGHHGHAGHGAAPDIPGIEPHFMSMVGLTEGKPVSPDGLVMEWIDTPFGPFFPGLPGGLQLALNLDGDSIAGAEIRGMETAALPSGVDLDDLADRLADAVPLSPVAMRELTCRAAEKATGQTAPKDTLAARAAAVERERIASHLNWLAGLARQMGLASLMRRATALQRSVRMAQADELNERADDIRNLLRGIQHGSLLKPKLAGIGALKGVTDGPVGRAAGYASDARHSESTYAALGFEPITQKDGDAMARLRQRCAEIAQSLDLMAKVGAISVPEMPLATGDGHGMATVETPRGPATLHLTLKDGMVSSARLTTPFAALAAHVPDLIKQMELADALTVIGSLDLDPWSASR